MQYGYRKYRRRYKRPVYVGKDGDRELYERLVNASNYTPAEKAKRIQAFSYRSKDGYIYV